MTSIKATDPMTLQVSQSQQQSKTAQTSSVDMQTKADAVEITKKEPKEKKSIKERFFNFIASCKKIGVNINEFGKGGFKAVGKGIAGAMATVGVLFTGNQIAKAAKAEKGAKVVGAIFENIRKGLKANTTKEGIKATLKSGKGIAAIAIGALVAVGVGIKTMYDATLVANQRKHDIDEKYQKTPAIKK